MHICTALTVLVVLVPCVQRFAKGKPLVDHGEVADFLQRQESLKRTVRSLQEGSSQLPPPPAPPAALFEFLPFKAKALGILMVQLPKTRRYILEARHPYVPLYNHTSGVIDLDKQEATTFDSTYHHFCSGVNILSDGRPLIVGGNAAYYRLGKKVLHDGRDVISTYNDTIGHYTFMVRMRYKRWYPTPLHISDGKFLIVGGTYDVDNGPSPPVAEVIDPANPHGDTVEVPIPQSVFLCRGNLSWYPFMQLLPRGEILWWCDRRGSVTDANFKTILELPGLGENVFPYHTMYKATSTFSPLALQPDEKGEYNFFSFILFGGGRPNANNTQRACPLSARMDFWYCNTTSVGLCHSKWIVESMLNSSRVMGESTVFPNGKIMMHAGAQAGKAGNKPNWSPDYFATNPANVSLMYDPYARHGRRFSFTGPIGAARMYHSTACLDISGKLLSAGCDSCEDPVPPGLVQSPDGAVDLRLTMGTPAEIGPGVVRPVITTAPEIIIRGRTFEVLYSYNGTVTGASIAAPCAVTHSLNMNQRVIFLVLESAKDGVARIRAPPTSQPAVAWVGYYMLFLLGDATHSGRTYSEGVWLRLEDA